MSPAERLIDWHRVVPDGRPELAADSRQRIAVHHQRRHFVGRQTFLTPLTQRADVDRQAGYANKTHGDTFTPLGVRNTHHRTILNRLMGPQDILNF